MLNDLSSILALDGITDRLKAVRTASDMRPQTFADFIGVKSRSSVALYEKPGHPPPADYLLAFCCKTNSHPVWVLTGLGSRYWSIQEQIRKDMEVVSTYLTDEARAVVEKVAGMVVPNHREAVEVELPEPLDREGRTTEKKRA